MSTLSEPPPRTSTVQQGTSFFHARRRWRMPGVVFAPKATPPQSEGLESVHNTFSCPPWTSTTDSLPWLHSAKDDGSRSDLGTELVKGAALRLATVRRSRQWIAARCFLGMRVMVFGSNLRLPAVAVSPFPELLGKISIEPTLNRQSFLKRRWILIKSRTSPSKPSAFHRGWNLSIS